MAILLSIGVGEDGLHQRTVIVDTVIDGHGQHHPLAARQPVGRYAVCVVQRKGAAERVGHAPEHVRPADGGAGYLQLAFLVGLHDVEITIAVHVLQGVVRAVDTVADRDYGV